MNYKLSVFCLSILLSASSLFSGTITIVNQTNTPATVSFKTMWPNADGTVWTQGENITAFAVPANSSAGWSGPNLVLNKFKFSSNATFAIGGAVGERFTAGADGVYSGIVVPTGGIWTIYIVNR